MGADRHNAGSAKRFGRALAAVMAVAALAAWAPPAQAQQTVAGVTPGALAVDRNGQATYQIPIEVPPGIAGMQPSLSLIYNSGAGNGPLGLGWSLGGLSVIQRCSKTIVQDREPGTNETIPGGIAYDSTDVFCLDGKRLIAINGEYGADGTEYRTEIDGFFKVVQQGLVDPSNPDAGPSWFQVRTKSGQWMNYGQTEDSRIEAVGRSDRVVREWAVNRIQDTTRNYMSLVYTEDPPTTTSTGGGYRIYRIWYTKNVTAGYDPESRVDFIYETRPDVASGYVAGSPITQNQRLTEIKTATDGAYVRSYRLGYADEGSGTSRRSRLTSVTECDLPTEAGAAAKCLQPITFEWQDPPVSNVWQWTPIYAPKQTIASDATGNLGTRCVDVNGDGLADQVFHGIYRDCSGIFCFGSVTKKGAYLNTGSGWAPDDRYAPPYLMITEGSGDRGTRFVDLNGDGLVDIVHRRLPDNGGSVSVGASINTGNPANIWEPASLYEPPYPIASDATGDWGTRFVDLNGDGLVDFVYHRKPNNSSQSDKGAFLNTGSGWEPVSTTAYEPPHPIFKDNGGVVGRFIDVNGDGLPDVVYSDKAYLNTGAGWALLGPEYKPGYGISQDGPYGNGTVLLDVNGDGLTDQLVGSSGTRKAYLSTGKGWVQADEFKPPRSIRFSGRTDLGTRFHDVNGDGRADLVWNRQPDNSGWDGSAYLNAGYGVDPQSAWPEDASYTPRYNIVSDHHWDTGSRFVDVNGDGFVDQIYSRLGDNGGGVSKGAYLNTRVPERIKAVVDSLGARTEIAYAPLTDKAIYEKHTGGSYPVQNIQAPIYVVAQVSRDNGTGGQAVTSYHYTGAKAHVQGRGFLGFSYIRAMDQQTGITTLTNYAQDFPFIGQVAASDTYLADGTAVSTLTNTWAKLPESGTAPVFPYVELSVAASYEPNHGPGNAPVTTVTTSHLKDDGSPAYDVYGNPTEIVVTTTNTDGSRTFDTFVTRTVNKYDNNPGTWILSRLTEAKVTKTLQPGGRNATRVSAFTYRADGLLESETIEPDSQLLPLEEQIWLKTEYTYDVFGNIDSTKVTGPDIETRVATTLWTADGRFPEVTTNALGHSETTEYDPAFGTLRQQTGPNGITTAWEYDAFGRTVRELRADGTETHWTYDLCGDVPCPAGAVYAVSEQDFYIDRLVGFGGGPLIEIPRAYSARKTAYFDILNRVFRGETEGFDGTPVYSDTDFNERGEVVRVSRPYYAGDPVQWTVTEYDNVGRPIKVTEPNSTETTSDYNGLVTTTTKGFWNTDDVWETQSQKRWKDAIGQPYAVRDHHGNAIGYAHDPFGNLEITWVEAADTQERVVTAMDYDIRGRKIWMNDPDMGQWYYQYNALGELIEQIDAKQQVVTMTYDLLGRMETRTEPDEQGVPQTTTWVYDTAYKGIGKLHHVSRTGDDYLETLRYDELGRPSGTTIDYDGQSHEISNAYHYATGQLRTVTYPRSVDGSRFAVEHGYTATGYLESVREAGGTGTVYWQAIRVNAEGQVEWEELGGGLMETLRNFDPATGLVEGIGTSNVSGDIQSLTYVYDGLGNLSARIDARQDLLPDQLEERFAYDGLNRLESATLFAGNTQLNQTTYGYDGHGNITYKSDVGGYTYSGVAAGPHAVTAAGGKTYAYDDNGNMQGVVDALGNPVRSVDWTSFNKPRRITSHTTTAISEFVYGPDRARIRQKIVDGVARKTVYYAGGLFERHEKVGQNDEEIHYIRAAGTVAIYTREVSGNTLVDKKTRYLHRDHLGSVDVITDENGTGENGAEPERLSYDAHGKRRETNWQPAQGLIVPLETPRGFTGHEHLDKLGLIHMNGRVYDPELGRFLSADPFVQFPTNTQSYNRYSYVLNNPLSFTDPSGFGLFGDIVDAIGDALDDISDFFTKTTVGQTIGGIVAYQLGGPIGYAVFNGLVTAANGGSLGDVLMSAAVSFAAAAAFQAACPPDACGPLETAAIAGGLYTAEGQAQEAIRDEDGAQSTTAKSAAGATYHFGGAKFANGAATEAFARLFNDVSLTAQSVGNWVGNHLDEFQIGLSGLGMTPVVGIVFDALNVMTSALRGDFVGASLDLGTMVPGAGQAVAPFAIAHRAGRIAKGGYGALRQAGLKDAHHVIQDAAVRNLPGYSRSAAPSVHLPGPSTRVGSPHYNATQVQRQAGGGTYGAERRIGYKALRRGGLSVDEARAAIRHADEYFGSIGVRPDTVLRRPGNRP